MAGLPSPPPFDHGDLDAGQSFRHVEHEAPPEEYQRQEKAAIRGDLETVISIFEAERLPNTPMERLDSEKFTRVMTRAIASHHAPVAA
jgi:hypothetical protein